MWVKWAPGMTIIRVLFGKSSAMYEQFDFAKVELHSNEVGVNTA